MKKQYCKFILAGVSLLILGMPGCSAAEPEARQGIAEHEVLTLASVDQEKMMITLRGVDGVSVQDMEKAIEEKFPDVDIVVSNNTWLQADLDNGCFQDIILAANNFELSQSAPEKFIDLSGETFTQNYYLSSMWESASGDGLFFLPGPSNIYGVVYNKDMFAEYGWELPETLDEFIALCQTIEKTGIRAVQPALYYSDAGRQFFTGFTYEAVFAGLENMIWYNGYRAGKTVMAGHMEPAFEIMSRFIEAGILRPEDYEITPSVRTNMMYQEESCAMILETQDAVKYRVEYGGNDAPEIGMMPFFSGNGENSDYLLSVPNYFVSANKALEEPGEEEKRSKVMDILAFMSTAEGQKAVAAPDSTRISSVRGLEWVYNDFLEGVRNTIEKGNVIKQPFFVGDSNSEFDTVMKKDMRLYAQGSITAEEVMRDLDEARDRVLLRESTHGDSTVIGAVEEKFTVLQTAQLFADIFKEKADAQIGLCMANTKMGGCFFKLYPGELVSGGKPQESVAYYIEEGFKKSSKDEKEKKLVKVIMTGDALLNALDEIYLPNPLYPDAYWVASGLTITFAPWAEAGSRVIDVTLPDGTAVNPEGEYTVAVWNGTVNPERISETVRSYDDSPVDLFRERLESAGSIKPELDGEFILVWDMERR